MRTARDDRRLGRGLTGHGPAMLTIILIILVILLLTGGGLGLRGRRRRL
jgi:hypothetical protein